MISREFRLDVSGQEDLLEKLVKGGRAAVEGAGRFLYAHAVEVFNISQYLVPVDTGALRSSGYVTQPYVIGNNVGVLIVYGQASAPYALWVHERLDLFHEPPTQAKFLEQPLVDSVEDFQRGFRQVIEKAIEGSGR